MISVDRVRLGKVCSVCTVSNSEIPDCNPHASTLEGPVGPPRRAGLSPFRGFCSFAYTLVPRRTANDTPLRRGATADAHGI